MNAKIPDHASVRNLASFRSDTHAVTHYGVTWLEMLGKRKTISLHTTVRATACGASALPALLSAHPRYPGAS